MENKRKIWMWVGILMILLLVTLLYFGLGVNCRLKSESSEQSCYLRLVRGPASYNPFLCSLVSSNVKDNCYFETAQKFGSVGRCDQINYYWLKQDCYKKLALSKSSEEICEKMGLEPPFLDKFRCFSDVAVEKRDYSVCDKLEYGPIVTNDLDTVRNNAGCFLKPEEIAKNPAQCDIEYCYLDVAEALNDSKGCDRMSVVDIRNVCYNKFGILLNDISFCEKIDPTVTKRSNTLKGDCFYRVALNKKDVSLCPDQKCRDTYYWGLGHEIKDPTLCDKIENNTDLKGSCYSEATQ